MIENNTINDILKPSDAMDVDNDDFFGLETKKNPPGGQKTIGPKSWLPEDLMRRLESGLAADWTTLNVDYHQNWFRNAAYVLNVITEIPPIAAYRWGLLDPAGLMAEAHYPAAECAQKVEQCISVALAMISQRVRSSLIFQVPAIYRFTR